MNHCKIKSVNNMFWNEHRSGWGYALASIKSLEDSEGIIFDGCIDYTFGYGTVEKPHFTSYSNDWVGFMHHPINICPWYKQDNLSPKYILESKLYNSSKKNCKAIFTLSNQLATYIRDNTSNSISVLSLIHPTEKPMYYFDFDLYVNNRKIIQLGAWMRKLTTFFKLNVGICKYMPVTRITQQYIKAEISYLNNLQELNLSSVKLVKHLSNIKYDQMLAESIVFMDLYDASANNAIIECIIRNTPVIVNKLPAVVEYLGKDYPLYYNCEREAEYLISNNDKIFEAHIYLKRLNKNIFSGNYFKKSLKDHLMQL